MNDLDPEGLIALEAPEDEYDPEVSDLVDLILGGRPVSGRAVSEIWIRWFGLDAADVAARQDDLHQLAERLRG